VDPGGVWRVVDMTQENLSGVISFDVLRGERHVEARFERVLRLQASGKITMSYQQPLERGKLRRTTLQGFSHALA